MSGSEAYIYQGESPPDLLRQQPLNLNPVLSSNLYTGSIFDNRYILIEKSHRYKYHMLSSMFVNGQSASSQFSISFIYLFLINSNTVFEVRVIVNLLFLGLLTICQADRNDSVSAEESLTAKMLPSNWVTAQRSKKREIVPGWRRWRTSHMVLIYTRLSSADMALKSLVKIRVINFARSGQSNKSCLPSRDAL